MTLPTDAPTAQFTIRPGDKPSMHQCSRCGGPLGEKVVAAQWNGTEFSYCEICAEDRP